MRYRYGEERLKRTVKMNSILSSAIEELDLSEGFLIENMRMSWHEITGEIIATHSLPERIFKGILFIAVDHPAYSNEIMLMKDMLLKRMRDDFKYINIKDIRVVIKRLAWNKRGVR